MAYQMTAMAVTLNDWSQVAGLFKCNPSSIRAAFYTISTDSVLAVPLRQLSFLHELGFGRLEEREQFMLETRKVDNKKTHKALFVNLRLLDM